jgi:thymidylate kinase
VLDVVPQLVVFEGLDRCGKTTMRQVCSEAFKHQVLFTDRFTTSMRVYDEFFHRRDDVVWGWYDGLERALARQGLTVFMLDTPPLVCIQRGAEYTRPELDYQQALFQATLGALANREPTARIILLPTGGLGVQEIVEKVRTWLTRLPAST